MAERTGSLWMHRALFLALAAGLAFVQLLPLATGMGEIPGPDVFVLMAFAWMLRRPDYVPVAMLAGVFLTLDLLFMRPPGLWAALVVLGAEYLRARAGAMRETGFVAEWLMVSGIVAAMVLADRLALAVFFVDQPSLGQTLLRLIITCACYPVVVALAARALGLRKVAPGEVNSLGRRI